MPRQAAKKPAAKEVEEQPVSPEQEFLDKVNAISKKLGYSLKPVPIVKAQASDGTLIMDATFTVVPLGQQ